jgi:uncharacterized delta-60 repeat protein
MFSYFNSYYRQLVQRSRSRRSATWVSAGLVLAVALLASFTTANAGGTLDPNFQHAGKVAKAIGTGADRAFGMVVQPDGKVVVAGVTFSNNNSVADIALVRFNPDGSIDPDFNGGQPVVQSFSTLNDVANAVTLQADGKILVAGYTSVNNFGKFMIARFTTAGALDTAFGNNGLATVSFTASTDVANGLTTMMVGGEEKIVAVGSANNGPGDFAVARLNADGTPDNTFGNEGKVTTNINGSTDVARGVTIQRIDGVDKIAVVGYSRFELGGGSFNEDIAVVRYNTDGSLDTSFGGTGKVVTNISSIDQGAAIVTQPVTGVNKLVVGGLSYSNNRSQFTVLRYNPNGSLDQEFNGNGRNVTLVTPWDSQILSLARQADDKIVAAGFANTGTTGANMDFAVARYNVDGRLDKTFGSCGTAVTTMSQASGKDIFYGVGVGQDGRIFAAGHTVNGGIGSNNDDFALLGYLPRSAASTPNSIDFDGDGRTEISVFRPGSGIWYMNCSCQGQKAVQFGTAGDRNVPADYDGDGRTDVAVYRQGIWYVLRSSDSLLFAVQWGLPDDVPVQADYDHDGKADLAVYRPSVSTWYILNSGNQQLQSYEFGIEGDIPVPADWGQGTTVAVFRPSTGYWYTSTDPATNYGARYFGHDGDIPAPGDFDGDGILDLGLYRPTEGAWYLQQSKEGFKAMRFGLATDVPVVGDYDGDTRDDIAVYRNGAWYAMTSTSGLRATFWGTAGDVPAGK